MGAQVTLHQNPTPPEMLAFHFLFNIAPFAILIVFGRRVIPTWSTISTRFLSPSADCPSALETEHRELESIATDTAFPPSSSYGIMNVSIAIDDLLNIVTTSKLDSRNTLSEQLLALRNETRGAANDFRSLLAKVNAVIDRVLTHGDGLLTGFEGQTKVRPLQLLICKPSIPTALMPPGCVAGLRLPVQFKALLNLFEGSLATLIALTFSLEGDLQQIQMRLDTIREMSTSEANIFLEHKHSVLAELWTFFGGNRVRLETLDRDFKILQMVYAYHGLTNRCASDAQQELRGTRAVLDELHPLTSGAILFDGISSFNAIMEQIRSGGEQLFGKRAAEKEG